MADEGGFQGPRTQSDSHLNCTYDHCKWSVWGDSEEVEPLTFLQEPMPFFYGQSKMLFSKP